jgi:endonuclease/exonuclease/phosphatase (EEP) superfamily protein YafD
MKILIIIIGLFLIFATVLPLLPKDAWWIRIFDFPRLQIMAITVIILLIYLFFYDLQNLFNLIFCLALLAAAAYQAFCIFPYTMLATKQVEDSSKQYDPSGKQNDPSCFSLMVANVLMSNRSATQLHTIIHAANPDLLLALETDHWWAEQLASLDSNYPYKVSHTLDNTYGMLLYSRLPLAETDVKFLVQDDVPSIHTLVNLPSGEQVELHCLHPLPPSPTEHERSTERDAELVMVGKAVRNARRPVVVAGDMNDVTWSRTTRLFRKVSRLLDPRVGRGLFTTFHAKYPLLRWSLDHVFHSTELRLIALKRLTYFGSDHFPIYVALSVEPRAAHHQEAPQAETNEWQEAQAMVDKAERKPC